MKSTIAALFLIKRKQMREPRILQGLKYGISCCVVWTVYLLEPLPHVAPIDRITYPIADSLALIAMGLLLGLLFGLSGQSSILLTLFHCVSKKEPSSYLFRRLKAVCFLFIFFSDYTCHN